MDKGAWWATVLGLQTVGHDLAPKQQPCTVHVTVTYIMQFLWRFSVGVPQNRRKQLSLLICSVLEYWDLL